MNLKLILENEYFYNFFFQIKDRIEKLASDIFIDVVKKAKENKVHAICVLKGTLSLCYKNRSIRNNC